MGKETALLQTHSLPYNCKRAAFSQVKWLPTGGLKASKSLTHQERRGLPDVLHFSAYISSGGNSKRD